MPDKFIVPQFIEKEDKILGPITVRQFLISLLTVFAGFIEYSILTFTYFVVAVIPTLGIGAVFAFLRVNGQPFHVFFLNFLQSQTRPKLRTWDKRFTDMELKPTRATQMPTVERATTKERPSTMRLRDLSLVVNTGGVYKPEDDEF